MPDLHDLLGAARPAACTGSGRHLEPGLTSTTYDPGLRPPLSKSGLLAGMAMTEKQGGSDVRSNTTRAVPADGHYLLTGHKWFCSAPMCDLFLVLAQAPGGLSCFLVPRVLSDGARNPFAIQRLKDKLGNRSNASAEIEFDGTHGYLVGDVGDGLRTILDMVTTDPPGLRHRQRGRATSRRRSSRAPCAASARVRVPD